MTPVNLFWYHLCFKKTLPVKAGVVSGLKDEKSARNINDTKNKFSTIKYVIQRASVFKCFLVLFLHSDLYEKAQIK